jgi:hypothetical protein
LILSGGGRERSLDRDDPKFSKTPFFAQPSRSGIDAMIFSHG